MLLQNSIMIIILIEKLYIQLILTETINKTFQLLVLAIFRFNNQDLLTIIEIFLKLGKAFPIIGKTAIEICKMLKYFHLMVSQKD